MGVDLAVAKQSALKKKLITGFSLRLAACRRVRYFLLVLQVTYAVLTSGGGGGMA